MDNQNQQPQSMSSPEIPSMSGAGVPPLSVPPTVPVSVAGQTQTPLPTPTPSDVPASSMPPTPPSNQSMVADSGMAPSHEEGMSYSTKKIIVILLLIFFYPLGLLFMFVWMKWPKWVKFLLTGLFVLQIGVIIASFGALVALISGSPEMQGALQCASQCQNAPDPESCTATCMEAYTNLESPDESGSMMEDTSTKDTREALPDDPTVAP